MKTSIYSLKQEKVEVSSLLSTDQGSNVKFRRRGISRGSMRKTVIIQKRFQNHYPHITKQIN